MVESSKGLHHLHKRERIYQKKYEPYPHPNKWMNRLDKIMLIISIIGPVTIIPQLIKIWFFQDASGVSPTTWIGTAALNSSWMIYAIAHKYKPLIINTVILILLQSIVFIGAIIYGAGF